MTTRRFSLLPLWLLVVGSLASTVAHAGLGGANWTTAPPAYIDPQIAAGANRVLTTLYDHVYYFDKSGNPITHVGNDPSKPLLLTSLEDIFDPIRNDVNTHLYLPEGYTCNLDHQRDLTYEEHQDGNTRTIRNYCLNQFGYDARILYDEYRQRFVIVAAAYNQNSKCGVNSAANVKARRNKILVAYSKTADPTDGKGWNLWWFDSIPGESCADQACRQAYHWQPGEAADYPVMAITKNYLMVSINNEIHDAITVCTQAADGSWPDGYSSVTATVAVWNADAFATGKFDHTTCKGACSWVYFLSDLHYPDGTQVTGWPALGRSHGDDGQHEAWFALSDDHALDKVVLWHFGGNGSGNASRPTLHRSSATIPAASDLGYWNSYPSSGHPNITPQQIDFPPSLVQRGSDLYYADVIGVRRSGSANSDASIRLAGIKVGKSGQLTLGRHAIYGAANEGYGSVALDVDQKLDIAMTYRRLGSGAAAGFGARYLIWKPSQSAAPSGSTLADDKANVPCPAGGCALDGRQDTVGMSLAPGGRFYLMQPYYDASAARRYAINYAVP